MTSETRDSAAFMKMHGLGNDFVVLDRRRGGPAISAGAVRALGDRHCGVGFDQLVAIEPDTEADARLRFWNADGSRSGTCGNATRCVARLLMDESGRATARLATDHGYLAAEAGEGRIRVNLGPPLTDWRDVPLADDVDTLALPIDGAPVATGMGNPHCTFFVTDAEAADLSEIGPRLETDPLFPERTNVELAEIRSEGELRLRVWERGAGITRASGSCAAAAVVAAHRRGLTGPRVAVRLDGGTLEVDWRADSVWTAGPTVYVFDGRLTGEWLATL